MLGMIIEIPKNLGIDLEIHSQLLFFKLERVDNWAQGLLEFFFLTRDRFLSIRRIYEDYILCP